MSLLVTNNATVAVEIEDTEGQFKPAQGATSYIQPTLDGLEMSGSRENVERNIATGTIGRVTPRSTTQSVSATMNMEFRTASNEGEAPESDKLLMAGLGAKSQVTTAVTTLTDHTTSKLFIATADVAKFKPYDIILVKEAGAYHVSPILSVDSVEESITLLVPASAAFSDAVVISKVTNYSVAETHPTVSVSKWIDGKIIEKAAGCRVTNMTLQKFATGQIPELGFSLEGLTYDQAVQGVPHTPLYPSSQAPTALGVKVFQDGSAIDINEMSVSLENAIGFSTSISSEQGKIGSRLTSRTVSGSINPYKSDVDVDNFLKFKNNVPFKLFSWAGRPKIVGNSVVAGEYEEIVAVYLPNCVITELSQADADGLTQESISFSADRGDGNIPEIVLAFI